MPDLRLSARLLRKYSGLTFVASAGDAFGIGISPGAFAFFYSQLYPRVPPDGDERIVALENWNVARNNENRRVLHDFVTWERCESGRSGPTKSGSHQTLLRTRGKSPMIEGAFTGTAYAISASSVKNITWSA